MYIAEQQNAERKPLIFGRGNLVSQTPKSPGKQKSVSEVMQIGKALYLWLLFLSKILLMKTCQPLQISHHFYSQNHHTWVARAQVLLTLPATSQFGSKHAKSGSKTAIPLPQSVF